MQGFIITIEQVNHDWQKVIFRKNNAQSTNSF